MTTSTVANTLPFAVLLVCFYRARLLALALIPPCALILVRSLELVDTSSASHPLRWIVPMSCAGLAGLAGVVASRLLAKPYPKGKGFEAWWQWGAKRGEWRRTRIASLLVLGSCAPDLLALHPFFWARFAEWPLVPLQISVCATILAVLLAPERWVRRWIPT